MTTPKKENVVIGLITVVLVIAIVIMVSLPQA
jgi:hypothetical protein